MEYDPFIKSQLASHNELQGLKWDRLRHVTVEISTQRNPRTPPSAPPPPPEEVSEFACVLCLSLFAMAEIILGRGPSPFDSPVPQPSYLIPSLSCEFRELSGPGYPAGGVEGLGYGIWFWDLGFGVLDLRFWVFDFGFGVWSLECGVWGLRCGGYFLGFGVYGSGIRISPRATHLS